MFPLGEHIYLTISTHLEIIVKASTKDNAKRILITVKFNIFPITIRTTIQPCAICRAEAGGFYPY